MKVLLALAALACGAAAYSCHTCDGDMCCNIPSDHQYYLTDFCGSAGTMACGKHCGYAKYFTADRQRFGCGKTLHICGHGKCLHASVQDAGPADWVEKDAGMPIIDASVPTCEYFTGHSGCGWSDRIRITAVVGSPRVDAQGKPVVGPFQVTHEEYHAFVGNETYWREVRAGIIDPSKPLPWNGEEPEHQEPEAPLAPVCCAPHAYTSYTFSWDEQRHWRAGLNISYDFTNQRVAMYIGSRVGPHEEHQLAELVDFKTKTAITVDFHSKTCHQTKVTHTMEQDCVPAGAQVSHKYKVAGQMPATLYDFTTPDGDRVYEQRADANCAAFQSAFIDHKWGAVVSETLDWSAGVDSNAFVPPSFCKTADVHPELVSAVGQALQQTGSVRSALRMLENMAGKQ